MTRVIKIISFLSFLTFFPMRVSAHLAIANIFQKVSASTPDIDKNALKLALNAFEHAEQTGVVKKPILTLIDFEKGSDKKRMWVIDLDNATVKFHTYVAHGKNSGNVFAKAFSNQVNSKESSLGTYVTDTTYTGHKGLSLHLKGLEKGINDNAYRRSIVMHGAKYVSAELAEKAHRIGRSWGCPAINTALAKPVIDMIKNGSVLFMYYPDTTYLHHSKFVVA